MTLPEILLGGSFNGVKLQSEIFHEPGNSPDQPFSKQRSAAMRSERFDHVMDALGRVMHWAMAERRAFMTKTMGVAPPTSKRVQQTLDSDLPHVIDADVDGVHAFEESEDSVDDSMPPVRCSFVRPAVGGPKTSRKASEIGKSKQEDNEKQSFMRKKRLEICRRRCLRYADSKRQMGAVGRSIGSCASDHCRLRMILATRCTFFGG